MPPACKVLVHLALAFVYLFQNVHYKRNMSDIIGLELWPFVSGDPINRQIVDGFDSSSYDEFVQGKCNVLQKYLSRHILPIFKWSGTMGYINQHLQYALYGKCSSTHLIWFFLRCGLAPRCFEVKEADPPGGSVTFYREKCIWPHEKLIFLLKTTDQSYLQNT